MSVENRVDDSVNVNAKGKGHDCPPSGSPLPLLLTIKSSPTCKGLQRDDAQRCSRHSALDRKVTAVRHGGWVEVRAVELAHVTEHSTDKCGLADLEVWFSDCTHF